jgi:hypothetical protein
MLRSLIGAATISLFAIAMACTPKARVTTADRGIANHETWVALEDFGTKIKVPNGWEFARQPTIVASFAKEARGAWVIAGTSTKDEAKEKLSIGLREFKIELGEVQNPPRDVTLNGITFSRQDFEGARVDRKAAHVVVLAADNVPKGRGIIVFIGYAESDNDTVRAELLEAIRSLSPN